MSDDEEDRLAALLQRWEELRAANPSLSLDDFLAQQCANEPALALRLQVLLRAAEWGSPLAPELSDVRMASTIDSPPLQEMPDTSLGPYKLLQVLGEGGFGIVYLAQQMEPIRRQVAIKLIKAGMDTRQVMARFEAERQALAMMDHSNIAKIFEAGTTANGRPYFVMELVKGVPLDKYCDQEKLTPRERLELFLPVCQAVFHAHQKGIIHRDLKPHNILVALYDGQPVPKVIDFGLAKAMHQQLTERTLFTAVGQLVGTLAYIAPEQAELNNLDIDTRADIYALGVILYELLTGSLPISSRQLRAVAFDEMLRMIREIEPAKPSLKLSSSEKLPAIAAKRKLEPQRLTRQVRGELDWIVMKCLEKERGRRYATADALAQDVQRFLSEEPVLAGPPDLQYRVRKYVRKHRAPVMAVAVLALLLPVAIAITSWGWFRASTETARARDAEQTATQQTQAAMRRLYTLNISRAQQMWDAGHSSLAWRHLSNCPQELRGWEFDYLLSRFTSHQETYNLNDPGVCADISPDGKTLVTGSLRGTITLLDLHGRRLLRDWKVVHLGKQAPITDIAFLPDGHLVSRLSNTFLYTWDSRTGEKLGTFVDLPQLIKSIPDLTPEIEWGLNMRIRPSDMVFSSDGKSLAVGRENGMISLFDTHDLQSSSNPTAALTLKRDANGVAPGERFVFRGHIGMVVCLAFSPDGKRLASGGKDHLVKIWDAVTGEELHTFKGHDHTVTSVTFTPDGKKLVSTSLDRTLKVWDTMIVDGTFTLPGDNNEVTSVTCDFAGKRIFSGGSDGTVTVWDEGNGWEPRVLERYASPVSTVAASHDGTLVASGCWQENPMDWTGADIVNVRNVSTGQLQFTDGTFDGRSIAFNAAGTRIALGRGQRLSVCDVGRSMSRPPESVAGRNQSFGFRSIAYSRDGRQIATGDGSGEVAIWNADTGEKLRSFEAHLVAAAKSVAFSPDGKWIVSGGEDNFIKVWDASSGSLAFECQGHTEKVNSVVFSPGDGKRIISGSDDMTVRIWDAETGEETLTLRGHTGAVTSVAVTEDGRTIVSGSKDGTIKIWTAQPRAETTPLD